jgi:hypothetical protein
MERYMELWKTEGVPHKGWECVTVDDLGYGNYETCNMCGNEQVRFIHVMKHAEYYTTVNAGCVCAGKMSEDYAAARERDREAKKRAGRKDYWLKRKWITSLDGSEHIRYKRQIVGIFIDGVNWRPMIGAKKSVKVFSRPEDAKMHLFDYLNRN